MSKLQENIDYRLIIPTENGVLANIEILTNEFKGVVFRYGKISVNENKEDDSATLTFEYDVINDIGIKGLEENENFKNFLGDLITNILVEQIERNNLSKLIEDDVNEEDIIEV